MNLEEVFVRVLIANAFLGLLCYVIGTAMYRGKAFSRWTLLTVGIASGITWGLVATVGIFDWPVVVIATLIGVITLPYFFVLAPAAQERLKRWTERPR